MSIQTSIPEFIENANILKSFIEGDISAIPKTGLRTLEYYTTLMQGGMSHYVAGISYTSGQFSFTLSSNQVKFWQANENIAQSASSLDTTKWTARAVFGAGGESATGGIALYSTGSAYSVGDVVVRVVDNFARLYQSKVTISSAPSIFQPQDWSDVTQTDTASITLKAYAETISGGSLVIGSVSSGVYSNPSNIGKKYVGTATISQGQAVPTNANSYVWEEIPGRIRVTLADFGSAGTALLGNKALSQSTDNFTHILLYKIEDGYGSWNEYNEIDIETYNSGKKITFSYSTTRTISFEKVSTTVLKIIQYHDDAKLTKIVGVR